MGRWAYFHTDNGVDVYEYKFWFGIQDSIIPWAIDKTETRIIDYDEDEAIRLELTEEQKEIWKEWSDSVCEEFTEEMEFLKDILTHDDYMASDTDANLSKYWNRLEAQARRMGLKRYSRKEGEEIMEAFERYTDEIINVAYNEKQSKKSESVKEEKDKQKYLKRLADINIKTLICCILMKYGAYECHYEK